MCNFCARAKENFKLWFFCENVLKKLYNENNFSEIEIRAITSFWLAVYSLLKLKCRHYCALVVVVPSTCIRTNDKFQNVA